MTKTYKGNRKWTTGRSTVSRPTDRSKAQKNLRESIKIFLSKFQGK